MPPPRKLSSALSEETPNQSRFHLSLGNLHEANGRLDEALAAYADVAAMSPVGETGLRARNRTAAIMIQRGEIDAARRIVAEILQDNPENASALLTRATFYFSDQQFDDAITDLRSVIRMNPDSEQAQLMLARAHAGSRNVELAQKTYRRVLEINPANSDASNELAELLASRGEVDKAESVLREQLKADPDDAAAKAALIQTLIIQGDVESAEDEVRSLLEGEDTSGLAEYQLGRVLQAKQSSAAAIAAYESALRKNPTAVEPLQGLITVLMQDGRTTEAIAYLERHMKTYPKHLHPKLLLGSIYATQGRIAEAEEQYEEIIAIQPAATRAYAAIAGLYPDDSQARAAALRRGVDANPGEAMINLMLAEEYERQARIDEAIGVYEDMLELNPENDLALNNMANLLLDRRSDRASHERALELAKRFEDSNSAALLDTLGWAHYRLENYPLAIRYLERAVEAAEDVGFLRYHLGMAYFANNSPERARKELELAVQSAEADFTWLEDARATLNTIRGEPAEDPAAATESAADATS